MYMMELDSTVMAYSDNVPDKCVDFSNFQKKIDRHKDSEINEALVLSRGP